MCIHKAQTQSEPSLPWWSLWHLKFIIYLLIIIRVEEVVHHFLKVMPALARRLLMSSHN